MQKFQQRIEHKVGVYITPLHRAQSWCVCHTTSQGRGYKQRVGVWIVPLHRAAAYQRIWTQSWRVFLKAVQEQVCGSP